MRNWKTSFCDDASEDLPFDVREILAAALIIAAALITMKTLPFLLSHLAQGESNFLHTNNVLIVIE